MSLQRVSEQNNINFLSNNIEEPEKNVKKALTQEELLKILTNEQKSKKLDNTDNGLKNSHSISSAGYSLEPQIKSNSKYIKCETSDSIWGENKLEEKILPIINKEDRITIALEKKMRQKKADEKRMIDMPASGNKVVFSKEDKKEYSFNSPKGNIGIFDNNNFENLPEKTAGEELTDNNKKNKEQKDESWKNNRIVSSKSFLDNLVENLNNIKK